MLNAQERSRSRSDLKNKERLASWNSGGLSSSRVARNSMLSANRCTRELVVLYDLAEAFTHSGNPENALNKFLFTCMGMAEAQCGLLYLRKESNLTLYAAEGFCPQVLKALSLVEVRLEEIEFPLLLPPQLSFPPWNILNQDVVCGFACAVSARNLVGIIVCGYKKKISPLLLKDITRHVEMLSKIFGFAIEDFLTLERLERQGRQLRWIAANLVQSQERERRHLASELHDQLGQALAAVKFHLETLSKVDSTKNVGGGELFSGCLELVNESMRELKRIMMGLRPVILEKQGLVEAIRLYLDTMQKTTGIVFTYKCEPLLTEIPHEVEVAIFRAVQETCANAIKHAAATAVTVQLAREGDELVLQVSDNGQGFSSGKVRTPAFTSDQVSGIVMTRERVILLGGKYNLFSVPGKGTRVEIRIPV